MEAPDGRLAKDVAEYLNCQIAAGVQAVQLFDSWAGCLTPTDYEQFVLPYTKAVIDAITPGVPVINFSTGTAGLLKQIRAAGGDVIGLDWRVNLDEGWATVGHDVAVQGNLDPVALSHRLKKSRHASRIFCAAPKDVPDIFLIWDMEFCLRRPSTT